MGQEYESVNERLSHFCTYFESNYLVKGLVLYRSLVRHAAPFRPWVLCLDGLPETWIPYQDPPDARKRKEEYPPRNAEKDQQPSLPGYDAFSRAASRNDWREDTMNPLTDLP